MLWRHAKAWEEQGFLIEVTALDSIIIPCLLRQGLAVKELFTTNPFRSILWPVPTIIWINITNPITPIISFVCTTYPDIHSLPPKLREESGDRQATSLIRLVIS